MYNNYNFIFFKNQTTRIIRYYKYMHRYYNKQNNADIIFEMLVVSTNLRRRFI